MVPEGLKLSFQNAKNTNSYSDFKLRIDSFDHYRDMSVENNPYQNLIAL